MERQSNWTDPFEQYLKPFAELIGDRRTWATFRETVKGIIGSIRLHSINFPKAM